MSEWEFNETLDVSWEHCGRPAYWQGEHVFCSKCQESMEPEPTCAWSFAGNNCPDCWGD